MGILWSKQLDESIIRNYSCNFTLMMLVSEKNPTQSVEATKYLIVPFQYRGIRQKPVFRRTVPCHAIFGPIQ